jgi:ATP synthase protein I
VRIPNSFDFTALTSVGGVNTLAGQITRILNGKLNSGSRFPVAMSRRETPTGPVLVSPAPQNRPPMAVAAEWVSRITTVGLEMAVPAGLGYWLDSRWGTEPWLVTCGAALGFFIGFRHLLQMVKPPDDPSKGKKQSE